jgi:hypothetical protein
MHKYTHGSTVRWITFSLAHDAQHKKGKKNAHKKVHLPQ